MSQVLLDHLALDALIPEHLARWRPLISEGLGFFLTHLPTERLNTLMEAQFALPTEADPRERLVTLLGQFPTLHKLGQVVARERHLDAALRQRLQTLESMPPRTPMAPVQAAIRRELPQETQLHIAPQALAEASVAVVVPFHWQSPQGTQHGVFKVLKPQVAEHLAQELAIWSELADYLDEHAHSLGLPPLDYRATLDSVRELLTQEVQFPVEQQNLQAAAACYAQEPRVFIPQLLPWCSPQLTAMQRVFGVPLSEAPQAQRHALANTSLTALLGQPFWSRANPAVFHADPHAGNLMLSDDGRLAILDWSLTARLEKTQREQVVQAVLGGLTLDALRLRQALAPLVGLTPLHALLEKPVEIALAQVAQGRFPGVAWLLEILDGLALAGAIRLQDELLLFRKAWYTLAGVVQDLHGQLAVDSLMLRLAVQRLLQEWPWRGFYPPTDRSHASHLSNWDVWQLSHRMALLPLGLWLRRWSL